jgi:hypothetical protein
VAAQRHDYTERREFEEAGRRHGHDFNPRAPGKAAAARLDDLAQLSSHHQPRVELNLVDACREYGIGPGDEPGMGEIMYRLLSGATHGLQWMTLPLSLQ